MNFTVIESEQRSELWFKSRAGRVTGSNASIIYMGEKTAGREDYVMQLALERMGCAPDMDTYVSRDMQHGIDLEPLARIAIEARDGVLIRETGFCAHNTLPIGCSLDGDSDDFDCLWSFKCPKSKTHLRYIEANELPKDYRCQAMHELYITGAPRYMFVSFDNRMPAGLELFTVEILTKDLPMIEYEKTLFKFLADVENMEAKLRNIQTMRLAA